MTNETDRGRGPYQGPNPGRDTPRARSAFALLQKKTKLEAKIEAALSCLDESEQAEFAALVRADAKRRGLKKFNTGIPCQAGHVTERVTQSNQCVQCVADKARERMLGPERVRDSAKKSERMKQKWQEDPTFLTGKPEWRKKKSEAMIEYHAKRKAASPSN